MAKRVNSRNTKAEILSAYQEQKNELKELRKQLADAQSAKVDAEDQSLEALGDIDDVVGSLYMLRDGIGESMSTLQQNLTSEATTLQELREEAGSYLSELDTLHAITFEDTTLESLVDRYTSQSADFDERMTRMSTDFDERMRAAHLAWATEKAEHDKAVRERNHELKKARARDDAEYTYEILLQRTRDEEQYELASRQRQQELDEFESETREALAAREDELSRREREYEELKSKVDGFDAKMKEATERARKEGEGIAKHQARVKADLFAKESEGQTRVFTLRIESLQSTVDKQRAQIQALNDAVARARREAQELAVKAIEGASNASTYQAVREIAMEQAKHTTKGK